MKIQTCQQVLFVFRVFHQENNYHSQTFSPELPTRRHRFMQTAPQGLLLDEKKTKSSIEEQFNRIDARHRKKKKRQEKIFLDEPRMASILWNFR
jgi:hypothetical protein